MTFKFLFEDERGVRDKIKELGEGEEESPYCDILILDSLENDVTDYFKELKGGLKQ